MLSLQGQFTFTAERPQLHCAAFFIAEPEELVTIHYDQVSIDCQRGDFLKVRGSARWPGAGRVWEPGLRRRGLLHPAGWGDTWLDGCSAGRSKQVRYGTPKR